jgi:hypothetical protein
VTAAKILMWLALLNLTILAADVLYNVVALFR